MSDIVPLNAIRYGRDEAVVDGDRRLSWKELERRVNRMSNALRHGLHIDHGQRVCILAENSLEYFELFHSTGEIGAITVPLNQRLALDEFEATGSQVEPRAIFYGSTFDEEAERLGPQPSDASSICFTGGTTGQPKGVVISHRALIANAQIVSEAHGMIGRDRHIFVRPMAVAPGHRMAAWHGYSGGTTIIQLGSSPWSSFDWLKQRGPPSHCSHQRCSRCFLIREIQNTVTSHPFEAPHMAALLSLLPSSQRSWMPSTVSSTSLTGGRRLRMQLTCRHKTISMVALILLAGRFGCNNPDR